MIGNDPENPEEQQNEQASWLQKSKQRMVDKTIINDETDK